VPTTSCSSGVTALPGGLLAQFLGWRRHPHGAWRFLAQPARTLVAWMQQAAALAVMHVHAVPPHVGDDPAWQHDDAAHFAPRRSGTLRPSVMRWRTQARREATVNRSPVSATVHQLSFTGGQTRGWHSDNGRVRRPAT
jgi:hypothetical protein